MKIPFVSKRLFRNRLFTVFLLMLFCFVIPFTFYYLYHGNLTGYQGPVSYFVSADASSKPFHWNYNDPTPPTLGDNGTFSGEAKEMLFDYENLFVSHCNDALFDWMDIKSSIDFLRKGHRIDLSRWGIDSTYINEEIINGTVTTTVTELELWTYTLEIVFTGMPDGTNIQRGGIRSWEVPNTVANFRVAIGLKYDSGIVESNANRTDIMFLLGYTTAYETNDGSSFDIWDYLPSGAWFHTERTEVDAVLSHPGEGHKADLYSLYDDSYVSVSEASESTFVSGIPWFSDDIIEKYSNVYFQCGIDKFSCSYVYDWSKRLDDNARGPLYHEAPQASLTFEFHVLVSGRFIFEVPQEELPDYSVDIDLSHELESRNWLMSMLRPFLLIFGGIIGLICAVWLFSSYLKGRAKTNINIYK